MMLQGTTFEDGRVSNLMGSIFQMGRKVDAERMRMLRRREKQKQKKKEGKKEQNENEQKETREGEQKKNEQEETRTASVTPGVEAATTRASQVNEQTSNGKAGRVKRSKPRTFFFAAGHEMTGVPIKGGEVQNYNELVNFCSNIGVQQWKIHASRFVEAKWQEWKPEERTRDMRGKRLPAGVVIVPDDRDQGLRLGSTAGLTEKERRELRKSK